MSAAVVDPAPLWQRVRATEVPPGRVGLWWLYQAGFAIKSPAGAVVLIDPYLSDAVLRSYQLPRDVPAPLEPTEADPDLVLATHPHEDHLDPDSVPVFARHPGTRIGGPPSVVAAAARLGVDPAATVAIRPGEPVDVADIRIESVFARHMFDAEPTPDAVGYLITIGDLRIYHAGDTEYDARILAETRDRVDVSLVCINGTTGNMNAHEAALLAWQQGTRLAVPMHYGLWRDADYGPGATLDPQLFVDTYRRLSPEGRVHVLSPGELLLLG
jgi:L-ascorbate 6-phosphate lactonase